MCSGLRTLVKHKWEVQVKFGDDVAFWNQVQRVPVVWELSECAQVWWTVMWVHFLLICGFMDVSVEMCDNWHLKCLIQDGVKKAWSFY